MSAAAYKPRSRADDMRIKAEREAERLRLKALFAKRPKAHVDYDPPLYDVTDSLDNGFLYGDFRSEDWM